MPRRIFALAFLGYAHGENSQANPMLHLRTVGNLDSEKGKAMNEYERLKQQRRDIEARQSSPLAIAADQLAQAAEKLAEAMEDEGYPATASETRTALAASRKVREGK
jgi:hypothetical protein